LKLKFLIDECTGKRLSFLFKNAGYDVLFVGDWKPSASDEEVLQKANDDGRILITDDKDFGELVYNSGELHSGVLILRLEDANGDRKVEIVKKIFSEADDCLEHKEGSLYIFRDIKWYIETDVEIVTLYDALRDIKNDDYLIVVACHESSKMGDSGGWFNNPWGLCEEIRIIYDASV